MDQLLVLLTGMLTAVMISINGSLTASVGMYPSAVMIHLVGVCFSLMLCLWKRERIFVRRNVPLWSYLGGAIGVLTLLFNNYSFAYLSMTGIVALALFGQCVSSNIIDSFGLFGMTKSPMSKAAWIGMLLSCVGIAIMLSGSGVTSLLPTLLSLCAGITIVLSRTVNSKLAATTGAMTGSFFNHLIGLPFCILLLLIMPKETMDLSSFQPWMLLGGAFGVTTVFLQNITVSKVAGLRLTMLSFVGQIFTGIALDLMTGKASSPQLFYGSLVVGIGLLAGMAMEWKEERSQVSVTKIG